jgi:regulator of RNase E activity RraA
MLSGRTSAASRSALMWHSPNNMSNSQNVGFRVFTKIDRPAGEVVDGLSQCETVHITDAMNRFGGMDDNIRPAAPGMHLCGPAITVRAAPGDNLMVYKAFEIAKPGDVLVVEARGLTAVAQWGDITSMLAKAHGLAGMVTDGSLRDLKGIAEVGFPVFAKPVTTPNGALKDGPGEVNVPVSVGGVPVLPGDIVIADSHGVAVVPRRDAANILLKATAIAAAELKKIASIRQGHTRAEWLEDTLRQKGCVVVEESWEP